MTSCVPNTFAARSREYGNREWTYAPAWKIISIPCAKLSKLCCSNPRYGKARSPRTTTIRFLSVTPYILRKASSSSQLRKSEITGKSSLVAPSKSPYFPNKVSRNFWSACISLAARITHTIVRSGRVFEQVYIFFTKNDPRKPFAPVNNTVFHFEGSAVCRPCKASGKATMERSSLDSAIGSNPRFCSTEHDRSLCTFCSVIFCDSLFNPPPPRRATVIAIPATEGSAKKPDTGIST
mmetsp:Transcript_32178/g.51178  ORF Transcript_32178/g.51178 Transcript_32178/m.51178 type:complete len:237 (+) Transcript_32178:1223-1933(+)